MAATYLIDLVLTLLMFRTQQTACGGERSLAFAGQEQKTAISNEGPQ